MWHYADIKFNGSRGGDGDNRIIVSDEFQGWYLKLNQNIYCAYFITNTSQFKYMSANN